MDPFKVVLADLERTLVRLFEDRDVERRFLAEVWDLCANDIPARVREAAEESPYALWMGAYRWMMKHSDPLRTEIVYHALTRIAIGYEMDAASSVRLFDDVQPILEQLKIASIPVVIVSNNATEAVERVLKRIGWKA